MPEDRAARTPEEDSAPQHMQPSGADAPDGPAPARPTQDQPEERRVEAELQELVAGLERERDEYLELARRTKADFENYRKRVAREASQAEVRGRAALAKDMLSVVDNLERALAAAEPRDDDHAASHIAEGVRLVYEELSGVLANAGVEAFAPVGDVFDPDQHEALMTRPAGPEAAGQVVEVFQKGYRLDGQILRPARVAVGEEEERPSAGKPPDGFAEGRGRPTDGFGEGRA